MKAIVNDGSGYFDIENVAVPHPASNQILVRVVIAAQNPTDVKSLLLGPKKGSRVGCEFSGVIAKLGPDVPQNTRFVGERVAGIYHTTGPNGAFAEYVMTLTDQVFAIPETMSFEDAAQIPLALWTSCYCLHGILGFPLTIHEEDSKPREDTILIWGGTTATGHWAIQLARSMGLNVISTSSPKNIAKVEALGAEKVFDYADSWTPRKIVKATGGGLKYAIDCVSEGMTPNQVSESLSERGGKIATLLPYVSRKEGIETQLANMYDVFGKEEDIPWKAASTPEMRALNSVYREFIERIIRDRSFRFMDTKLYPEGLLSVADGMEYMRSGNVHGEKIIYRVSDTPGAVGSL